MENQAMQISGAGDFQRAISDPVPTLVDFWAAWCGPCRRVAPVLAELAEELAGVVKIAKVDVDRHPELAVAHRVSGIPTLILFSAGREIDRIVGAAPKAALREWLLARSAAPAARAGDGR